jgi:predicted lysophospholipase L1 biosynthesis ABC-type transport system permease subunit
MSAVDPLESFGDGALVPFATAKRAAGPDEPLIPSDYVVTFRPGIDRVAALTRLGQLFPRTVLVAPSSVDVDALRRVDWLPVGLAGLVGLLSIGMLAHVIVTSVRGHRHDFGVLRAIGFASAQIGATVVGMALVVAVVMLVIGLPVGIAAGQVAWRVIAAGLGTEAGPHWSPMVFVVVPLTMVAAVAIALWPAWRTTRRVPAEALRTE